MKLWIATDGDGTKSGFTEFPVRNKDMKFWTTEEASDFFEKRIDLTDFNILPNQTWKDEPQLVEFKEV